MARPAAGVGRQAQVARLLVAAALAACANQGEPPGGPPHTAPPQVVSVVPESGAVLRDLKGDAVIQFDEVIDEMPQTSGGGGGGGPGGGGGVAAPVTGLARQIVLSPVAGDVRVSWHRSAIHVKPSEGWKPNRVYHLELLPGIVEYPVAEVRAGLRPGTPDNAPIVGALTDNVIVATGHYRNGVLLTPVTADAVAELVATGVTPDEIKPFAPGPMIVTTSGKLWPQRAPETTTSGKL